MASSMSSAMESVWAVVMIGKVKKNRKSRRGKPLACPSEDVEW